MHAMFKFSRIFFACSEYEPMVIKVKYFHGLSLSNVHRLLVHISKGK